jgi:hypothetical protein
MSKPLRDTFLGRVLLFVRGIIFYNTVDWKRASDGLKPPRLSRSEREMRRPLRDLSAIKPREKPRAKSGTQGEADPVGGLPQDAARKATAQISPRLPSISPLPLEPLPDAEADGTAVRKKRRRVRLQSRHDLGLFNGPSPNSQGLLARFFKKKD